jgi:hypothetical protein
MVTYTVAEIEQKFREQCGRTAGEAMAKMGALLLAGRNPTKEEEEEIFKLAGACNALAEFGRNFGWVDPEKS